MALLSAYLFKALSVQLCLCGHLVTVVVLIGTWPDQTKSDESPDPPIVPDCQGPSDKMVCFIPWEDPMVIGDRTRCLSHQTPHHTYMTKWEGYRIHMKGIWLKLWGIQFPDDWDPRVIRRHEGKWDILGTEHMSRLLNTARTHTPLFYQHLLDASSGLVLELVWSWFNMRTF